MCLLLVDKIGTLPFSDLLSHFVDSRVQASRTGKRLMPLIVTVSTSSQNANFHFSSSGQAEVHSITVQPLDQGHQEEIFGNVMRRLVCDAKPDVSALPQSIKDLLPWTSGRPRLLCWLICSLSGRNAFNLKSQQPRLGEPPDCEFIVILFRHFKHCES